VEAGEETGRRLPRVRAFRQTENDVVSP
jgi:hypothetical protein